MQRMHPAKFPAILELHPDEAGKVRLSEAVYRLEEEFELEARA